MPVTEDLHWHVAVKEIVFTPLQPGMGLPFALKVILPATLDTADNVISCRDETVVALEATLNETFVMSGMTER